MVVALIAVRFLHWLEVAMGWHASVSPDTARTVLGALGGAMFTFIVFVCSSLLLVVQLASAQLTPRVIGTMFRDRFELGVGDLRRVEHAVAEFFEGIGLLVDKAPDLFRVLHRTPKQRLFGGRYSGTRANTPAMKLL